MFQEIESVISDVSINAEMVEKFRAKRAVLEASPQFDRFCLAVMKQILMSQSEGFDICKDWFHVCLGMAVLVGYEACRQEKGAKEMDAWVGEVIENEC